MVISLYLFTIPLDFITGRYLMGLGLSTILSVIIVILFLFVLLLKKELFIPKEIMLLVLLCLIGLLPLIFTYQIPINRIITFVYYILVILSLINILKFCDLKVSFFIKASYFGIAIMCLYLLFNGTMGYGGTRLTTIERDMNPNVIGGFFFVGIAFTFSLFNEKKGRIIYTVISSLFFVTLLLIQSKTAFICVFVALVAVLIFGIKTNKVSIIEKTKKTLKLSSIALLLAIIVFFSLKIFLDDFNVDFADISRLDQLLDDNINDVTTGRMDIWIEGIESAPMLWGTGFMTYRDIVGRPAHNTYVASFVEGGILGLVVLLLFFIYLFIRVKKIININYFYTGIFLAICILLFSGGNDIMEYKFFWLGLIMIFTIYIGSDKTQLKKTDSLLL